MRRIHAERSFENCYGLIGCVSELAARDTFAQGRVMWLHVADLDLRRRFYMVSHREKYVIPGIRAFLDTCAEATSDND